MNMRDKIAQALSHMDGEPPTSPGHRADQIMKIIEEEKPCALCLTNPCSCKLLEPRTCGTCGWWEHANNLKNEKGFCWAICGNEEVTGRNRPGCMFWKEKE